MPEVGFDITASASSASSAIDNLIGLLGRLKNAISGGTNFSQMNSNLEACGKSANKVAKNLDALTEATEKNARATQKAANSHKSFLDKLKRVAGMMMLRGAIRGLTSAVSDGIKYMYNYSKAIGGVFANSMDTAATNILYLKNSLASALAPAINALIPLFSTFANIVNMVTSAIAQLIAVLTGASTWTQANKAATQFDGKIKGMGGSAKKASDELKELLADFDELNVIQQESSSGGGGGGGGSAKLPAFSDMFSEQELSPFFKFLSEHLELVKAAVALIGAAFLAWKLPGDFINNFKIIVGLLISIQGGIKLVQEVMNQLNNGLNMENLKGQLEGIALLALGLYVAFGNVGLAIAFVVGGITELVLGFKDWYETGALSEENSTQIAAGFLLIGAAIALLTGTWLPLAAAAIGAIAVWVAGHWDSIVEAWENFKTNTLTPAVEWINTNVITPICDYFTSLSDQVATIVGAMVGGFIIDFQSLLTWFDTIFGTGLATVFTNAVNAVINVINTLIRMWNNFELELAPKKITIAGFKIVDFPGAKITTQDIEHLPLLNSSGEWSGTGLRFEEGGFPQSGQLYMARENGVNEYIGSFGNRSVVANNDQIVEGISSGVERANEGVESRLNRIEEMLSAIVDKEFSVNFTPSAQIGRVVAMSEKLYARQTGG